jgi:uncharacterized HAD superfamily protein
MIDIPLPPRYFNRCPAGISFFIAPGNRTGSQPCKASFKGAYYKIFMTKNHQFSAQSGIHPGKVSIPMPPLILPPERLGFDIDGVVADTAGAFLRIAAEDYGIDGLELDDIVEYEVENCIAVDPAIIQAIFTRLMEDPVGEGMEPMPHAVTVLEKLAAAAPLCFITARPYRQPILDWLQKILSRRAFAQTKLVATGQHDGKAPFLRSQGLRFFIDDRAETCETLKMDGFTPIVYHQPWNAGRHSLASVDNWQAIEQLCFP